MSDDATIYPTHQCFDDVADFLNDLARRGAGRDELTRYTVVHGICLMPPDGEPYAHGWLECDGFAIQAGIYQGERIYFRVTVEEYRAARFVWDETRYRLDEVLELDAHGRPPYPAEYKGLCSDTRPDRPGEPREWTAPPMTITDAWRNGPVTETGKIIFQLCTPCLERIQAKTELLDLIASTDHAENFAWELYRVLCDRCKRIVPPPPVFP